MKKFALTLCIAGTTLALAACETTGTGNVESGAPYGMERTASHGDDASGSVSADSERAFRKMQSK